MAYLPQWPRGLSPSSQCLPQVRVMHLSSHFPIWKGGRTDWEAPSRSPGALPLLTFRDSFLCWDGDSLLRQDVSGWKEFEAPLWWPQLINQWVSCSGSGKSVPPSLGNRSSNAAEPSYMEGKHKSQISPGGGMLNKVIPASIFWFSDPCIVSIGQTVPYTGL